MTAPAVGYTGPMCSQCGSTDPEDVDPFENDGYSVCCNEPIDWQE